MESLTLQDCCTMQTGISLGRYDFSEEGNLQVIQLKDIDANGRLQSPLMKARLERQLNEDKFIRNNDILLKSRGTNMTATHIENAPPNTIASLVYFILRPNDKVLPGFLAWYLNNTRFPVNQSIGMPMLQLSEIKTLTLNLPDRVVQQRITDADKLIEGERALSEQYYTATKKLLRGIAFNTSHTN
ncbi:MAG: restriction endonuclease subunit S [Gammaproteobacteria bacterium]|nr:restriction endonuclease subunit S [Gammaproteobacteria bacterium]